MVSRAAEYGLAKAGNKWARARVISKAINKGTPSVEPLPNNVGWGPRQSIHVVHDKMNADGVVFNNVYDNGYSNNQVIFSFRDNLKNGRLFKKEANTLASNKYPPYDMAVNYNPDRSLNVDKVHRDVARERKDY